MAQVYSKRFLGGLSNPGSPLQAVVPSGVVWVVRSITAVVTTPGETECDVITSAPAYIWAAAALTVNVAAVWSGRHVVNAGETLQARCVGLGTWMTVSGYELSLP